MRKLGPRFRAQVKKGRAHSRVLLKSFIRLANAVTKTPGTWSFEWPTSATGWKLPELQGGADSFDDTDNIRIAHFHGCRLGLTSVVDGAPIKKPWTVLTTNHALASDLGEQTCQCKTKHVPCQGKDTKRSENYTPAMAKLVVRSLKRSQGPSAGTSCAAQTADPNAVLLAMLECHPWRAQTHRTGIAKSHVRTFHTSKSGQEYSKRRVTEPQQSEYHATGPIVDHVRTMLPDFFTPW